MYRNITQINPSYSVVYYFIILKCLQYSIAMYTIQCIQCTLYTVYTIQCIQCTLYTVYNVHCATQYSVTLLLIHCAMCIHTHRTALVHCVALQCSVNIITYNVNCIVHYVYNTFKLSYYNKYKSYLRYHHNVCWPQIS